jgi:hypothetical protein
METRKSFQNRKAGYRGDGKPFGLPNNANLESMHPHVPVYVGICGQLYGRFDLSSEGEAPSAA